MAGWSMGDQSRKASKGSRMQLMPGPRHSVPLGKAPASNSGALGLELCGYDPRKQAPKLSASPAAAVLRPALPPALPADPLRVVSGTALGSSLAVSGQAAPAAPAPQAASEAASPSPAYFELQPEDLSSSDEDRLPAEGNASEALNYRKYRYAETQQPVRHKAAQEQPFRRRQTRRVIPREATFLDSDDENASPWGPGKQLLPPASHGWLQSSPSSSSTHKEEKSEDEELKRVGEVLIQFYGLPGGMKALRFSTHVTNMVAVEEAPWEQKERSSQLEEAPMLWLRGGRVYDFHGDRGTVAEFENDLLVRMVEDDNICRQRRREQGLQPFPFVALPIRRQAEEAEETERENGRELPRRG